MEVCDKCGYPIAECACEIKKHMDDDPGWSTPDDDIIPVDDDMEDVEEEDEDLEEEED